MTEPQPEPPAEGLVENEGVNAVDSHGGHEGVRSGGRPEAADEQLDDSPAQDGMTDPDDTEDDATQLAGAPDPTQEAGGQDSGSID